MRTLFISLAVSALTLTAPAFGFDQSLLEKTFEGSGTWIMEGDQTGSWSSVVTLRSTDRGILVQDSIKVESQQGIMQESTEWLAEATSNGFFKVLLVERDQSQQQQQQGDQGQQQQGDQGQQQQGQQQQGQQQQGQQQQGQQQQGQQQQGQQQQGQQQIDLLANATLTEIGNGYCIELVCHIEFQVNGFSFEETYLFKSDGKLKRIGSMDLAGASDKKAAWKSILSGQTLSM